MELIGLVAISAILIYALFKDKLDNNGNDNMQAI